MAQKMLIVLVLLLIIFGWLILDQMKGPDLRIYLQSPGTVSDYWSIIIENPGPKLAKNIGLYWTEISIEGLAKNNSRKIDLLQPGDTISQQTSVQNGTLEVELKCCGNFRLFDKIEVGGGQGPPYLILQYNPLVHPIYSTLRFTGFLQSTTD